MLPELMFCRPIMVEALQECLEKGYISQFPLGRISPSHDFKAGNFHPFHFI